MINLLVVNLRAGIYACLLCQSVAGGPSCVPAHYLAVGLGSSQHNGFTDSCCHVTRT